jgi:hypothetical protein
MEDDEGVDNLVATINSAFKKKVKQQDFFFVSTSKPFKYTFSAKSKFTSIIKKTKKASNFKYRKSSITTR